MSRDWSRALRRAAPYAVLAAAVAVVFWPLFERMAQASYDFRGHVRFARRMLQSGAPHSERFGFEILTQLAAGFSRRQADLARAAAIVATLATAAKAVLSARWLARERSLASACAIAAAVLFLAPITFASHHPTMDGHSAVHLGQISGFVLHNPTTVVVFPFAIALFAASWRGRAVSTAVLAAVQCLVKPSFVAAWVPVFPFLELWRGRRDGGSLVRSAFVVAAVVAPALAVLAWQYTASNRLGTMAIDPWRAWGRLSPDIPSSIARSLAFPVLLFALHFREARRRPELLFAWSIFGVAFAQYALLYLRGTTYPGNWSWGRYLSVYLVFLLSVELFARIASRRESWRGWRAGANGALVGVLLLHLGSGVFYYWQGLRHGLW